MTYTIKRAFAIFALAIFGSVLLYNCEPEADSLGEQLFLDGAAQGNEISYDLIAYNINNNDTIRSDASKLFSATLGVFNEAQFGKQKASYLTQLRLFNYNPDFGTNAIVDSVVLVVKPAYATDSITTTTDDNYIYPDGNVAAKKVVNTYPVYKFGKAKKDLTVKVREITDFMNGSTDIAYSNASYTTSATDLGSKVFNGKVNSVAITKDSDGTSIFTTSAVGLRIPLDKNFFQTKVINMKGKPELQDASNFIRHIKGLKISVEENDGYLMQFSPNDMELIMYYKYDKVENAVTTRPQTTFKFNLGAGNVHVGQYEYDRAGAQIQSYALGNTTTGDTKLFAQGMGGPSIGIKIPVSTINQLKQLYQDKKAAIIGARVRIYTDASWNNNYANGNSKYTKPNTFTIVQKDKDTNGKETTNFTTDLLSLSGSINFAIYKQYDLDKNPAYYDFTVTKSLKDIVESGGAYTDKYFKIDLGNFLTTTSGALAGYQYTSRPFEPRRAVFVGSDPGSANKIQLKVIHGTK